jgi:hypothetical protein
MNIKKKPTTPRPAPSKPQGSIKGTKEYAIPVGFFQHLEVLIVHYHIDRDLRKNSQNVAEFVCENLRQLWKSRNDN